MRRGRRLRLALGDGRAGRLRRRSFCRRRKRGRRGRLFDGLRGWGRGRCACGHIRAGNVELERGHRLLGRGRGSLRCRRGLRRGSRGWCRGSFGLGRSGSWCSGLGRGTLVGGLDLGWIVFRLLAGAALHVLLAELERHRQVHIGRALERDSLLDLPSHRVDVKLGGRRAIRLAALGVRADPRAIGRVADRIEEAVAKPHADRLVAPIRVDAAIDGCLEFRLLLLLLTTAEEVEQAASARLLGSGAAARARESLMQLGLLTLVAAAADDRLALLLKLGELAARVLDTRI